MIFGNAGVGCAPVGMKKRGMKTGGFSANFFACLLAGAISLTAAIAASPATADEEDLEGAVSEGSIILDARARIEVVDDADRSLEKGRAATFRLRIGYETAEYRNFTGLIEGEFVQRAGMTSFNDTVNGKTGFAVIADPNVAQLNRAQLTYTGFPGTTIIAGRQRITIGDGRFVGSDGFRQNEQTFDALRIINQSFGDTTLSYTFIGGVNRIFGGGSQVGRFTGETHLFEASYAGLPVGTITAYAYLVDLEQAPTLSSKTFGVRLASSRRPWRRVRINYGFEFATQRSYGRNPADFDLGYLMGELGAAFEGESEAISLTARIEWLDGDGSFRSKGGFNMPLGSLHDFQGFADRFTVTPASGLQDAQLIVAYDMKALKFAKNIRLAGWYHKYSAVVDSGSLGREVNLAAIAKLTDRLTLTMQYADFNANPAAPREDREIIWATLVFDY